MCYCLPSDNLRLNRSSDRPESKGFHGPFVTRDTSRADTSLERSKRIAILRPRRLPNHGAVGALLACEDSFVCGASRLWPGSQRRRCGVCVWQRAGRVGQLSILLLLALILKYLFLDTSGLSGKRASTGFTAPAVVRPNGDGKIELSDGIVGEETAEWFNVVLQHVSSFVQIGITFTTHEQLLGCSSLPKGVKE